MKTRVITTNRIPVVQPKKSNVKIYLGSVPEKSSIPLIIESSMAQYLSAYYNLIHHGVQNSFIEMTGFPAFIINLNDPNNKEKITDPMSLFNFLMLHKANPIVIGTKKNNEKTEKKVVCSFEKHDLTMTISHTNMILGNHAFAFIDAEKENDKLYLIV